MKLNSFFFLFLPFFLLLIFCGQVVANIRVSTTQAARAGSQSRQSEIDKLNADLAAEKQKVANLQVLLATETRGRAEDRIGYEAIRRGLTDQNTGLKDRVAELEGQVSQQGGWLSKLAQFGGPAAAIAAAGGAALLQRKVRGFENQLADLQGQFDDLQARLAAAQQDSREAKAETDRLRARAEAADWERGTADQAAAEAQDNARQAGGLIRLLDDRLRDLDGLRHQVALLQQDLRDKERDIAGLRQELTQKGGADAAAGVAAAAALASLQGQYQDRAVLTYLPDLRDALQGAGGETSLQDLRNKLRLFLAVRP